MFEPAYFFGDHFNRDYFPRLAGAGRYGSSSSGGSYSAFGMGCGCNCATPCTTNSLCCLGQNLPSQMDVTLPSPMWYDWICGNVHSGNLNCCSALAGSTFTMTQYTGNGLGGVCHGFPGGVGAPVWTYHDPNWCPTPTVQDIYAYGSGPGILDICFQLACTGGFPVPAATCWAYLFVTIYQINGLVWSVEDQAVWKLAGVEEVDCTTHVWNLPYSFADSPGFLGGLCLGTDKNHGGTTPLGNVTVQKH